MKKLSVFIFLMFLPHAYSQTGKLMTTSTQSSSQRVLIDVFKVPKSSQGKFVDTVKVVQSFIRTLPGFVEGSMFTKIAGESEFELVTTAVWTNAEALENAKKLIPAEMKKRGINSKEIMQQLGITVERGVYETSPY